MATYPITLVSGFEQLSIPVIQGGMGIGVSLGKLAGSVMQCGGIGVISCAHPGYQEPDFYQKPLIANQRGLMKAVELARSLSPNKGLLGVNIMCAGNNYAELVKSALEAKVDAIISGAGLPLPLAKLAEGYQVKLAPIISSARACDLVLKRWMRDNRCADFVVLEGPEAGGHLGFNLDELLNQKTLSLKELVVEVKAVIAKYEEQWQKRIPLFVGGGVNTADKVKEVMELGADGVQIATPLITTHECDAAEEYKQQYLNHRWSPVLVASPAGYPGRAFATPFVERMKLGKVPVKRCVNCLSHCNPADTIYCISEALIQAVQGNVNEGLFFTGANGGEATSIRPVSVVITELLEGQYD